MTNQDAEHMRTAIDAAWIHVGLTAPNPCVGCVIVGADGQVLGEAVTGGGGRPHAEEQVLAALGEKARGATAYVTLEPCGERSAGGKSCSQLLVEAGVARVVVACRDPSPYASGRGMARLREAGLAVEDGLLAEEAAGELGYLTL